MRFYHRLIVQSLSEPAPKTEHPEDGQRAAGRPDQPDAPPDPSPQRNTRKASSECPVAPDRQAQPVPGAPLFTTSASATEHPVGDQGATSRPSDPSPQDTPKTSGECPAVPGRQTQPVPGAPLFSGPASAMEHPEGERQRTTRPDPRSRRVYGAPLFSAPASTPGHPAGDLK